jgi:NAD(P)-dependent dehydrogenase (short-subunit alcohol dehydrogenase family)
MASTIFITGASRGIGRAAARTFHQRGWNVVATMRDPRQAGDLDGLERVFVPRLDVQDPDSIRSAVEAGLARFGGVDVLLNNAGYGAYGALEATPPEKIRRQFEVNVLGLLATTQALLPHFRANRRGTILNLSSIGGRIAFPLGTLYHGSKFAVEGLSEALHYELGAIGIRVKLIEPGMVRTDFGGSSFDFSNDPSLTDYQPLVQSLFAALGPLMAAGSPPELVAEALFAAATDASDRLRYEVGPDAEHLLAGRRAADDATFLSGIKAQFGLLA